MKTWLWMIALSASLPVIGEEQSAGHLRLLHRTASGVYYESHKLPIDPILKTKLAVILVGLTIIAFFSMMIVLGRRDASPRTINIFLRIHRLNGYIFIVIAVLIAQYCVRILGVWGHLREPMVALHIGTAIPIVLLPILKLLTARFFRGFKDLLPAMGITTFILTWVAAWMVIIHFYKG